MDESTSLVVEQLELIFFFGLIGVFAVWFAYSRGYFSFPKSDAKTAEPLSLNIKQVAAAFVIYLGTMMFIGPLVGKILKLVWSPSSMISTLAANAVLQLFTILMAALLLFLYCRSQNRKMMKRIWKDASLSPHHPWLFDYGIGVASWFISFPIVVVVGQLADLLLYLLFNFEGYEQVAVRYLKTTLTSSFFAIVALFTVVVAAPVIEELLFRGFLQNYFKKYIGTKAAILLTALGFALFHLAPSQGLGNISLAISLFVFASFLGFVYERQKSLFASIGLHMFFNLVSSLRILFLEE